MRASAQFARSLNARVEILPKTCVWICTKMGMIKTVCFGTFLCARTILGRGPLFEHMALLPKIVRLFRFGHSRVVG